MSLRFKKGHVERDRDDYELPLKATITFESGTKQEIEETYFGAAGAKEIRKLTSILNGYADILEAEKKIRD